jgi:hypothetical protein
LVSEESKKLIVKFVHDFKGNPTKHDVGDYMKSEAVPQEFRLSWVTTLTTIDELDGDRIRVTKGKRRGQSHRLSINDKSRFDWITQHLSKIEKDVEKISEEEPEMKVKLKNGKTTTIPTSSLTIATLCMLAYHVSHQIKNENDQRVLNDKILKLMIRIGLKDLGQLRTKLQSN